MNVEKLGGFAALEAMYADMASGLRWPYVFCLPGWLEAWWRHFGAGYELLILAFHRGGELTGIAPLKRRGQTASLIGDASVCDYQDFIVKPGKEQAFCESLLAECAGMGIATLELETLRPDSFTVQHLVPFARSRGLAAECREADVSYEMALPASYEQYLAGLEAKQRHELLRKQRNLEMEAATSFRMLADARALEHGFDIFLNLMSGSRSDKAVFLTDAMRAFFRDIARATSGYGLLRLGFLDLGTIPVAAVLAFIYNNTMYLYNSGYDPAYAELSVGLLSKLGSIRWAIEQKVTGYDLLKGPEVYKERLGGQKVSLSACRAYPR